MGALSFKSMRSYSSGQSDIIVNKKDRVLTMTLNRPERYNAINIQMYRDITKILNDAAEDDDVAIVKLTGAGKYYSSGNDLKDIITMSPSEIDQAINDGGPMLEKFVSAFIDFPKMLVAAVNGPAVGITVTTLGLFDAVYACDHATFHTPFAKTGQSPEGCSSYTFPKLLGQAKAANVLYFGHVLTANEVLDSLVTKIFPASSFEKDVDNEIQKMLALPIKSLVYTKKLMRDSERALLNTVNKQECERLLERWRSEDFINAVMKFAGQST